MLDKHFAGGLLLFALAGTTIAQGRTDYMNFESSQVKPITTAEIQGRRYLLACNTPDNSIEVYALDRLELAEEDPENAMAGPDADFGFCARIPVGLEPVSVTTHVSSGVVRMYTANWLSDSVTFAELTASSSSSLDDEEALGWRIERVVDVGDEPMCVAVMDGSPPQLFVAKRSQSSYSQLDATTGAYSSPYASNGVTFRQRVGGGIEVYMTNAGVFPSPGGFFSRPPSSPTPPLSGTRVLKEPHAVAIRGQQAWFLGHQGGGSKLDASTGTSVNGTFNLDIWAVDLTTASQPTGVAFGFVDPSPPSDGRLNLLGTTNFNMAFSEDGELYVVGTDAMNHVLGNEALSQLDTGFVRTMLYKVVPATMPSAPGYTYQDLNDRTVLSRDDSMAHCTDVVLYLPEEGAETEERVCLAAFNSDNIGIIPNSDDTAGFWTVEITRMRPGPFGPRGLAVSLRGANNDSDDRIYVLNRFNSSISILDPNIGDTNSDSYYDERLLATIPLQHDPVPEYIRDGQEFLYSTQFSATGLVSCASCHVDARSDQLPWRLSSENTSLPTIIQTMYPVEAEEAVQTTQIPGGGSNAVVTDIQSNGFPFELACDRDAPEDTSCGTIPSTPNGKGAMVTQSLQGLLNFEVGQGFEFVTNAPYHWRGDKASFVDFNEAFVTLQGATDLVDDDPDAIKRGISTSDMTAYEAFINSVHYPPNPYQPSGRVYEGALGDPEDPDDGSGTLLGLKLFHILPVPSTPQIRFEGRSCIQCHFLPEGSNNRISCIMQSPDPNSVTDDLPFEFYPNDLKYQPIETSSLRGLLQKEAQLTFIGAGEDDVPAAFSDDLRSGDVGLGHEGLDSLSRNTFLTPLVSVVDQGDLSRITEFTRRIDHGVAPIVGKVVSVLDGEETAKDSTLELMESQVEAANSGLAVYARIDGADHGYFYRSDVQFALPDPLHKYMETPGGSWISRTDLLALLDEEDEVLVFIATPLGSDRRVASLVGVGETLSGAAPANVVFSGTTPNTAYAEVGQLTGNLPNGVATGFRSLDVLDALQQRLINGGVSSAAKRHEPSRRVVIAGDNIRPGAQIRITIPMIPHLGFSKALEMPIYPASGGTWQTAVELDPLLLYVLRAGGFSSSKVQDILDGEYSAPGSAPASKSYLLHLRNEGSSWVSFGLRSFILY